MSGRDHDFREPTLRREQTVRSENFSGELNSTQINSTQLNNVNASTSALIRSTTLDGRRPINNWARRGRNTICVTVHSREHHLRRASACGRPNWAGGYSQGRSFEKKKKLNHCSNQTEGKKNMAVPAPTATLSETINHTSIPHSTKLKDQRYTTAFPLSTPFHSQASRCCFPITQMF